MYPRTRLDPRLAREVERLAARQVSEVKRAAIEQIAGFKQRLAQLEREIEIERSEQTQQLAQKDEKIAALEAEMKRLQAEIEELAAATADAQSDLLRQRADLDNTRKRLERTFGQRVEHAKEAMLVDFIGVMDNLELALRHATDEDSQIREGVEATLRQWQQTLEGHGIRPIIAQNQPFDPEMHDAIASVPSEDAEPDTVIHVEQTGYTLGDKLLRPARVIVAQGG